MRLILTDRASETRRNFYPLALSRPIWELRCGMTSLAEKLVDRLRPAETACFVPPYLAEVYRRQTSWPVNRRECLRGANLLVVDARVKAAELAIAPTGPSGTVIGADGEVLVARIAAADAARLPADSLDDFLRGAREQLSALPGAAVSTWNYTWELVLANAKQLAEDFVAAGRSGIEGTLEQPSAVRGSPGDVYIAPGVVVHPMVVLDATGGPIYLDERVEVHPFTRIEGPCFVGRDSVLLGARCRAGNSIGPVCRVGGEIEETIIQAYSNKYHDGFLGHAYVGEWVNLGAFTANSDLKNDYSSVSVTLDGRTPIPTGSTKFGALIGDHTRTSIGTLLNTGTCVGAMTLLVAGGGLLPRFIPSFAWCLDGVLNKGFGKARFYTAAAVAMVRRHCAWTEADESLWDEVYQLTTAERESAFERSQKE